MADKSDINKRGRKHGNRMEKQQRICCVCNMAIPSHNKSYFALGENYNGRGYAENAMIKKREKVKNLQAIVEDIVDLNRCTHMCDRCHRRVDVIQKNWSIANALKEDYHRTKALHKPWKQVANDEVGRHQRLVDEETEGSGGTSSFSAGQPSAFQAGVCHDRRVQHNNSSGQSITSLRSFQLGQTSRACIDQVKEEQDDKSHRVMPTSEEPGTSLSFHLTGQSSGSCSDQVKKEHDQEQDENCHQHQQVMSTSEEPGTSFSVSRSNRPSDTQTGIRRDELEELVDGEGDQQDSSIQLGTSFSLPQLSDMQAEVIISLIIILNETKHPLIFYDVTRVGLYTFKNKLIMFWPMTFTFLEFLIL